MRAIEQTGPETDDPQTMLSSSSEPQTMLSRPSEPHMTAVPSKNPIRLLPQTMLVLQIVLPHTTLSPKTMLLPQTTLLLPSVAPQTMLGLSPAPQTMF